MQGIITLYVLLEAVVGDVTEAAPTETPRALKRDDGSWLLDGMLSVEDFRDLLDLGALPGEDDNTFETLGGFVMARFGRIPAAGDTFEWNDYRFEVLDMDGRRIDKVLLVPADAARTGD